jgi:hypothetical protein
MTEEDKKLLRHDHDGLETYEFLANHIDSCNDDDLDFIVNNMITIDLTGQYLASAARYLHAIDAERYSRQVKQLVAATIDKDREHRFLADVLTAIYGENYQENAEELSASDNNFRRIYKRLFPNPDSL